jgi:hypothetical protein
MGLIKSNAKFIEMHLDSCTYFPLPMGFEHKPRWKNTFWENQDNEDIPKRERQVAQLNKRTKRRRDNFKYSMTMH